MNYRHMTVSVYVRSEDKQEPCYLCEWPVANLDEIVKIIKAHGTYDGDNAYDSVFTQFVNEAGNTYFEIVAIVKE